MYTTLCAFSHQTCINFNMYDVVNCFFSANNHECQQTVSSEFIGKITNMYEQMRK